MENELGRLLEQLRGKMSLREVSEKTGLSHTYIRDLEKGVRRATGKPIHPSPVTLKKLAECYNFSFEELMKVAGYTDFLRGEETDDKGRSLHDLYRLLVSDSEIVMFNGKKLTEEQRQKTINILEYVIKNEDG